LVTFYSLWKELSLLDSERNKERSLSGRLLLSPSMSTLARAVSGNGRNPNRHFSDIFKHSRTTEEKKPDLLVESLSKA